MASGDQPIVVGGPHMITVQLPDRSPDYPAQNFTIAPKDPAVPFKHIVITDGTTEVVRWPLSADWKITIA
jgi:hypothetical protein